MDAEHSATIELLNPSPHRSASLRRPLGPRTRPRILANVSASADSSPLTATGPIPTLAASPITPAFGAIEETEDHGDVVSKPGNDSHINANDDEVRPISTSSTAPAYTAQDTPQGQRNTTSFLDPDSDEPDSPVIPLSPQPPPTNPPTLAPITVTSIPKLPSIVPPPTLTFDPPDSLPQKGLPLSAAQWTFSSEELQEIVSRAIRLSARESYIRLLSLNYLDKELPEESERLELLKTSDQAKYKFHVQRRTMLLQALNSFSLSVNTTSPAGGTPGADDPTVTLARLTAQLSETNNTLDNLTMSLVQTASLQADISGLVNTHWGGALAIALRKLNGSYCRRTKELVRAREKIASLEAELNEAWAEAERMAHEMDQLEKVADDLGAIDVDGASSDEDPFSDDEQMSRSQTFAPAPVSSDGLTPAGHVEDLTMVSQISGLTASDVGEEAVVSVAAVVALSRTDLSLDPSNTRSESTQPRTPPASLIIPVVPPAPVGELSPSSSNQHPSSRPTSLLPPPVPPKSPLPEKAIDLGEPFRKDRSDAVSIRSYRSVRTVQSTRSHNSISHADRVASAKKRSSRASMASLRLPPIKTRTLSGSTVGSREGSRTGSRPTSTANLPPLPPMPDLPDSWAKASRLPPPPPLLRRKSASPTLAGFSLSAQVDPKTSREAEDVLAVGAMNDTEVGEGLDLEILPRSPDSPALAKAVQDGEGSPALQLPPTPSLWLRRESPPIGSRPVSQLTSGGESCPEFFEPGSKMLESLETKSPTEPVPSRTNLPKLNVHARNASDSGLASTSAKSDGFHPESYFAEISFADSADRLDDKLQFHLPTSPVDQRLSVKRVHSSEQLSRNYFQSDPALGIDESDIIADHHSSLAPFVDSRFSSSTVDHYPTRSQQHISNYLPLPGKFKTASKTGSRLSTSKSATALAMVSPYPAPSVPGSGQSIYTPDGALRTDFAPVSSENLSRPREGMMAVNKGLLRFKTLTKRYSAPFQALVNQNKEGKGSKRSNLGGVES